MPMAVPMAWRLRSTTPCITSLASKHAPNSLAAELMSRAREYVQVVAAAGSKFEETVFVDDSLRNIKAAKELGITTIYVANRGRPQAEWDTPEVRAVADYTVPFTTYDEMFAAFPALFERDAAGEATASAAPQLAMAV